MEGEKGFAEKMSEQREEIEEKRFNLGGVLQRGKQREWRRR